MIRYLRYFCDKNLSFGGSTSPPLYDDPAELVAQLAHWESQVERRKSLRQLDDLVGTGTWKEVMALYQATRDVCSFIGVRLASEDEPDKAFGPSKQGTVLGIFYDLSSWEWKLCPEKANKILELLFEVIEKDRVENRARQIRLFRKM